MCSSRRGWHGDHRLDRRPPRRQLLLHASLPGTSKRRSTSPPPPHLPPPHPPPPTLHLRIASASPLGRRPRRGGRRTGEQPLGAGHRGDNDWLSGGTRPDGDASVIERQVCRALVVDKPERVDAVGPHDGAVRRTREHRSGVVRPKNSEQLLLPGAGGALLRPEVHGDCMPRAWRQWRRTDKQKGAHTLPLCPATHGEEEQSRPCGGARRCRRRDCRHARPRRRLRHPRQLSPHHPSREKA